MQREAVRARIQAYLTAGAWPARLDGVMKAVIPAADGPCAACTGPLHPEGFEVHVVYPHGPTLRLHLGCERLWREEVQPLQRQKMGRGV